jgi:hypothetical protein
VKLFIPAALGAAIAAASPSAASAKDVCVSDADGRDYRFENPKLPKKAGKVTAILGAARLAPSIVDAFSFGPIYGSVMPLPGVDDTFVVSLSGTTQNVPFAMRATVGRDFSGNGVAAVGAGADLDDAFTWTAIDCDESSLP